MSEVYLGQIMLFAGNYAPKGFALCAGQLLPISQNTALFSLLGTMYGGDGKSNFGLPNLPGNAAIGCGQGPGLSDYTEGEITGSASVTLNQAELPSHRHAFVAVTDTGTSPTASNNVLATAQAGTKQNQYLGNFYSPNAATTGLSPMAIGPAGGGQAHNNMQPYLPIAMCIALQGVYPQRP